MNRSVLIVSPFFAPQSHVGVFRTYKLAKYLPQHGWKPYVVTTDTNYLYNEDMGLLDALPDEVEIHRARHIEPTLRGVRMALGGRDRTFNELKTSSGLEETGHNHRADASVSDSSPFGRLYRYLLDTWLQNPDAHWTWGRPAIRMAVDLIKRHQIPLVYTSAVPFTVHHVGYKLQSEGVRWIADFRDPAAFCYLLRSSHTRVFARQQQLERTALDHADAVVVTGISTALIMTEMYGLEDNYPFHIIPTGLDESLLHVSRTSTPPPYPYLIFTGEYLVGYGEQFFKLFSQALDNPQVARTGIKALFIGRKDVNGPLLTPLIQKYGLEQHAEVLDHLPQEELYHYLQGAKAALLISGRYAAWWRLSAKLIDYIALRKPVVAIVPDPSEARIHLQRSGLGIFLDGDEANAVEQLTDVILGRGSKLDVDEHYCNRFSAREQLSAFVELFESVLT